MSPSVKIPSNEDIEQWAKEQSEFHKRRERALAAFEGIDEIPEAGAVKELVELLCVANNVIIGLASDSGYGPNHPVALRIQKALAKFGGAKDVS